MSDPSSKRTAFTRLTKTGMTGREGKPYEPSDELIEAVNVALACGMPLLLTGEPGCGKTDLAWAVASVLDRDGDDDRARDDDRDRDLLECHVRSDTRARDLLYHYDAVCRFGDGQLQDEAARARAQNASNYITLQPLGRAVVSRHRRVVLIDEIDKAPRDLPNDLLRTLDERRFEIPEIVVDASGSVSSYGHPLRPTMAPSDDGECSLIVITSNVERQLPEPFLRRCVFYHIEFPAEKRLRDILEAHFEGTDSGSRNQALRVFLELRHVPGLTKKPATAELLTWMQALTSVFEPSRVERSLQAFAGDKGDRPAWRELPGLSSLLKLREDLETIGASGTPAKAGAPG